MTTTQYEVLSPWADADLAPLQGISPRIDSLRHKRIGLYTLTYKNASILVNREIERRLSVEYPTIEFSYFERDRGADLDDPASSNDTEEKKVIARFEEWIKDVDAVVGAVGD
jgi:hypothetical protein